MMTWSYRTLYNEDDRMFYITEAYFDKPGGEVTGYISDGVQPVGETKEELLECLRMMLDCFDKPTIQHTIEDWLTQEEKDELQTSSD
jgi:hypothetical protein